MFHDLEFITDYVKCYFLTYPEYVNEMYDL